MKFYKSKKNIPRHRIVAKCELCKDNPAEYAVQYIGDDIPQFYCIGWHIRGFYFQLICSDCKMIIETDYLINNHEITGLKGCTL